MKVVLINPYELGRQPFGLAQPAAWLQREGCEVVCLDLSVQRLDPAVVAGADLVAIYLPMHTATRIALEILPRVRQLSPQAALCAYGLYAPVNETLLREVGVGTVLGGEFEPGLVSLVQRLRRGERVQTESVVNKAKIDFLPPDRSGLPPLARYAYLKMPDGTRRTVGFAEASRGCKHLCRHCPVVPVYEGRFRIVPVEVVMHDVRQQVAAGAQHISFGDPDFLNGPTHALRLVEALRAEFPDLTYDATIKIQHLIDHAEVLPTLKRTGCLFVTSAVESVDDDVLQRLDKNHTSADFRRAIASTREAGIALAPTFVPFTPWSTLEGYRDLLATLVELRLVESVPPIQLAIRLLVPEGSYLLRLPDFRAQLQAFDAAMLGYPWRHEDARVDALQRQVQAWVERAETEQVARADVFGEIWRLAHAALDERAPALARHALGEPIPHLSEAWYCCAEPTQQQLQAY